jgi:FemAB-related protein (PEP-CTERM system-associated)
MDVVSLTSDAETEWERFVERSPHGSVAHLTHWRNAVVRTYGHAPHYLMALAGGRVAGVLPLFLIRRPILGSLLVTAPYLSHGGLCADTDEASRCLVQAARTLSGQYGARYVEIRSLSKADCGLRCKDSYCAYFLPLHHDPETVWARLANRARTAVRKAVRSGLTIEHGHHLVKPLAQILSRHMRGLGTPFHGVAFYRNILDEFGDRAEVFMVRYRDRFVGGGLTAIAKDALTWPYGGCLKEYRHLAAMNLLTWEVIRYGCEQGLAYLDFGRSRWESGTALFKEQWKAEPSPLFYEYHLGEGAEMPDMDPTNPRFRLPIAVWKRLPVAVVRAFGPRLIKGIP